MSNSTPLTLEILTRAVAEGVALRARLRLQPAGGPGAKVFPPTYVGDNNASHGQTRYATETRRIEGVDVPCVLLDSVASQANRVEEALLDAWEAKTLDFPVVRVDFSQADSSLSAPVGSVSALEAPHRIYDAILRDSVDAEGVLFRQTDAGNAITHASLRNATALYHYCPTALVFGAWDSTGPKGGMGSKFPRALSSEVVGVGVRTGTKVGGRLDPLGIVKRAGPVYASDTEGWQTEAPSPKAKALNPSDINHGNVAPQRDDEAGGVTIDHALQTTVLSLPALRRVRLLASLEGRPFADRRATERTARVALAALALAGVTLAHHEGHDLRSGTLLVPEGPLVVELLGNAGAPAQHFTLTADSAIELMRRAADAARQQQAGWLREPIPSLRPAPKLVQLLRASQSIAVKETDSTGES